MKKSVWLCVLLLSVIGIPALAQDVSARISGTVLDASGAGVPNAKVTVSNTDRNQVERTVTADTAGNYSAPLLPIGNYALKVEAKGFKTVERTGVVLNVNDDLAINFAMPVGAVTETVEVAATAAQVETGTATGSTTIEGVQVRELALNTRNYEELVALMPGVAIKANPSDELFIGNSSYSGASAAVPFSVNGSRTSANNWTVDGADNVDRGANLTLMTFPSPDAIGEFTVERTLYPADTGRAGGAQINVVTRSGSKQWHGSLFEFLRNDKLASNNWSNNANKVNLIDRTNPATPCTTANYTDCYAKIPPIRWNDFGGNIGGPVPLGNWNKDHNKTFFFFQEEAHVIHTYTTFNPTMPTTAMLLGNFAQPVCVTLVNGTCPAGQAPVTQISPTTFNPVAVTYIKDIFSKLPLDPTGTSTGFFPEPNIFDSRQEVARIDQSFSEKFSLWGKFENDSIPTTEPGGLFLATNVPNMGTTKTNSPGQSLVIHAVNSIHPTLLNEAMFTYSHSAIHIVPEGLATKANSPDVNPAEPFVNTQGVIPAITFSGIQSFLGYGPYNEANRNWAGSDSVTWIKGRHTMKFGVLLDRYNKSENLANQEGTFTFTSAGVPTGTSSFNQEWANFLLGNVATFTMPSQDLTPNLWQWQTEAYAQDQFRVMPRLTLSMGVRYSYYGQPTDAHGMLLNFDPALYNPANAPVINPATGTITSANGTLYQTNGIIQGGKNSPFGDGVTNRNFLNFGPRLGMAWDVFGNGTTSIRAGYGVYFDSTEVGTFEAPLTGDPPNVQTVTYTNASLSNITGGTLSVPASPPILSLSAVQLPAHIPYTQNWSFDVQRQIGKDMVLDVGYYGSKGTHLLGAIDLDQVPSGVALAAGLHAPNGNTIFTSADDPHINAIRPFLGFSAINAIETEFNSNYHSLQVDFTRRFASAGLFNFSYTWSKALNDSGGDSGLYPQSSYNIHEGEYAPYPGDRKHVLSMNYIYTIPAFAHGHGIANKTLGGWEVSGIFAAYTGTPFTVTTSSVDPGGLGILGASGSSARPDLVCNPNANQPAQYNGHTGAGQPLWFNTACFQPVPQGVVRPGNTDRGTVRGPGYFNVNTSLIKNIGLAKEDRVRLQIRGEAFNVLNWVNPGAFSSVNNTSSSFGQISTFRAARRIQLAAKLIF